MLLLRITSWHSCSTLRGRLCDAFIGWLCALLLQTRLRLRPARPVAVSTDRQRAAALLSLLPQSHFRALSSLTLAIPGPRTAAGLWMNGEWQTTASPGSLSGPVALGFGNGFALRLGADAGVPPGRPYPNAAPAASSEVWKANSYAAQVIEECKLS